MGPKVRASVAVAIAVRVIHGSASDAIGARQLTWSQTKNPCHPTSSARAASRATVNGSDRASKSGTQTAERIVHLLV